MSITDEGVHDYVNQWHIDLGRIATALERIENHFEVFLQGDHFVNVKQVDTFMFKEELE